eukprot:83724-Prorocentrum_lima.AAC.1
MTSSLVGSEMCIRDSVTPMRPSDLTYHARCSHAPRSGCQRVAMKDNRLPVSYTHLTLPTICSV